MRKNKQQKSIWVFTLKLVNYAFHLYNFYSYIPISLQNLIGLIIEIEMEFELNVSIYSDIFIYVCLM